MGLFAHLFSHDRDEDHPALHSAIERAVDQVEPMLRQVRGFPSAYRKPVAHALRYAHTLASALPGPVDINRKAYASDTLVHALFPSADDIDTAFYSSLAVQDYFRKNPDAGKICAMMGMRRMEKHILGMELEGEVMHRDIMQTVVYFSSHTIEHLAPTEQQARESVSWSFFDRLVSKIKARVEIRKRDLQVQQQEKDLLVSRLYGAGEEERAEMEKQLHVLIGKMQNTASAIDLGHYIEDFEAVLLQPETYLRLDQVPIVLDSMGIVQEGDRARAQDAVLFNELIGYDRRNWTITMVCGENLKPVLQTVTPEQAYRKLVA